LKGGTPAGPRGDEGEGSTLRTTVFAYKKKKAITAKAENKTVSGGIAWLLDHLVRSQYLVWALFITPIEVKKSVIYRRRRQVFVEQETRFLA